MTDEQQLNEKWDLHSIVAEAVKTAHAKPSPETLKLIENIKSMEIERHEEIMTEIRGLKKYQVDFQTEMQPIIDIYRALGGTNKVFSWIFKNLIIPLSVGTGIVFSVLHFKK